MPESLEGWISRGNLFNIQVHLNDLLLPEHLPAAHAYERKRSISCCCDAS